MTGETAMSDTTFTPDLLRVIHPLDDAPEQKLYHAELGNMAMTATVRVSLLLLRAYLAGMVVLVMWRVLSGL
jgi:hypothetical protein